MFDPCTSEIIWGNCPLAGFFLIALFKIKNDFFFFKGWVLECVFMLSVCLTVMVIYKYWWIRVPTRTI